MSGSPRASTRGVPQSGPIQPAQLVDLLTPSTSVSVIAGAPLVEDDMQSALFIGADPARCQGVVGYGRYPLLPSDYTGREARTQNDRAAIQHQLLEVSATYPGTFDAAGFLESVRGTVSGCQRPVTAWGDSGHRVTVDPAPLVPGPAEIVRWSTDLAGQHWVCDFAVTAKANVVSQIVTCSPDRSVAIEPLALQRLAKINQLLKSTA